MPAIVTAVALFLKLLALLLESCRRISSGLPQSFERLLLSDDDDDDDEEEEDDDEEEE